MRGTTVPRRERSFIVLFIQSCKYKKSHACIDKKNGFGIDKKSPACIETNGASLNENS